MNRKGFAPILIILIVVVAVIAGVAFWYLGTHLAGGGGSDQIAPDSVQAGQPAVVTIVLDVTGAGGSINGRYTDINFYYRLAGESAYKTLQPQPVTLPDNYQKAESANLQFEAYDFTIPPYPTGTVGSIQYYYEMKLDGVQNHADGYKEIQILPASVTSSTKQTNTNPVSLSQSEGCTLLPYTGTIPLSQVSYYTSGDPDWRGGMNCKFSINPNLPIFTFHFVGNSDNTLGNIEITEGTSTQIIQTIQIGDPGSFGISYGATLSPATDTLATVDANFDGYKDLQILNNCGATGNCSYDFYLYNPSTNQFVENSFLTNNIATPTFDAAKKQVTTSWNSSVADWETDTYQYENNQYVLVEKVISTSDRNNNVATIDTYQLQNGQMELTNSTTTPVF